MITNSAKSPCLNCNDRHQACHSKCELYIIFRKELDEKNEWYRKSVESRLVLPKRRYRR